ncbi:hypothetical protein BDV32DRAFT_116173 [Aspergillus pseudonomiae]|uniref:Uncharacterized protein n=1 Tax=Aspergillus pseudonomiae TaxID=1506151 RepID=A0A5N7D8I3_9EURO|nr:uncharacterized protein BDV37DRAFT_252188 [Aspergillus pseudonomiae]KAB8265185.1 hypothetical protein BDV32DRAFT_116173 [Aspergillus pseudonomiae]KAE8402567.1 hypothetical protein BDV37DRAFT_252188 [Aspergillus pseudonomiae]
MSVNRSSGLRSVPKCLKCVIRVSHFISLSHSLIKTTLQSDLRLTLHAMQKPIVAPSIHGSAI